ncbi:MAG: hypothetical protein V4604_13690 [Bacteroidota bacterium]
MTNRTKTPDEIKDELKEEMERISDLWSYCFLEYENLATQIRNPKNTSHKYVGVIIGNFIDTFDIIYSNRSVHDYAGNMSLMQAIYIQQDFIEELLQIFRCGIDKGQLKKDDNYNINRSIRNELMGHPIRKIEGALISTTLLAYNGPEGCINYSRYHVDNGFAFEMMSHSIKEIIVRHTEFIRTYFSKIIAQIKKLMKPFIKRLQQFESAIETVEFSKLLDFTSKYFESMERQDYIYDKSSLMEVYAKRDQHLRYQNLIEHFYNDLKESIKGRLESIDNIFNPKEDVIEKTDFEIPEIIINIFDNLTNDEQDEEMEAFNAKEIATTNKKKSYHYELGKLATNPDLFEMMCNILRENFSNDPLIIGEIDHMTQNRFDEVEYYSAYRLLRREVEKYEEPNFLK